jgi:phage shock protein PspC (stress-responsive transcriptional regulator)/uncharacterized membrane protein
MTSDLPPTGGSQPPPESSPAGPTDPAVPPTGTTQTDPPPSSPPPPSSGSSGHGWSGHGWSGHGSSEFTSSGHPTDDFFNRIRSVGMVRPDDGRWVAGVAAAVARRWDVDPILVRGLFVATTLLGGIGVIIYGLAWLLLPQDDGRIHVQQAIRGDITAGFLGAFVLSLAAIGSGGGPGPWHNGFWLPGGPILVILAVGGLFWLSKQTPKPGETATEPPLSPPAYGSPAGPATTATAPNAWTLATQRASEASRQAVEDARRRSAESTQAAKSRRARSAPSKLIVRLTLGTALLLAAAILVIGNSQDWIAPTGVIATASALAVVAVGVIASGLSGRRAAGLAGIGILLTIGTTAGVGADHAGVRSGQHNTLVGQQEWFPSTPAEAERQFNLLVGEGTLDLRDPAILKSASPASPLLVRVRVGAGHLSVVLPEDTSSSVDLTLAAGQVVYPDGSTKDFNNSRSGGPRRGDDSQMLKVGPAGSPTLIVDVEQGAGQLEIRTSSENDVPTPSPTPSVTGSASPSPTPTKK